jgi:anti-sigma regulatory factor (Ser/Thr protein kinase)
VLAQRRRVLLVVRQPTAKLLRGALDETGRRLDWRDPQAFYQRIGFACEGLRRYLARRAGSERIHVVTEPTIVAAAGADRVATHLAYESMYNEVFAGYESSVACLWDTRHHPAPVTEEVRSTHPYLLEPEGQLPSAGYIPAERYLAGHNAVPPVEPSARQVDRDLTITEAADLPLVRHELSTWAVRRGFSPEAADDITVAVGEVTANAIQHGRMPARMRCWAVAGTLVVQVDDGGTTPVPAHAGYRAPTGSGQHGYGLWLARQFADTLIITSTDRGTAVRLYFPFLVTHRAFAEL